MTTIAIATSYSLWEEEEEGFFHRFSFPRTSTVSQSGNLWKCLPLQKRKKKKKIGSRKPTRPTFQNFRASKSGDRRILIVQKTSCDGLWSSKVVKESVGIEAEEEKRRSMLHCNKKFPPLLFLSLFCLLATSITTSLFSILFFFFGKHPSLLRST